MRLGEGVRENRVTRDTQEPGTAAYPGLSSKEAAERLREHGPNAVPEERRRSWRLLAARLWAPVPWMLEATVTLELVLGKWVEAGIVAAVLALNALLGFVNENRAQAAVALLRRRLAVRSRVLRDGSWHVLDAAELVPGDVVHVRLGDLLPADLRLLEGRISVDQSALTGESLPVDLEPGGDGYASSVVSHGEATAVVTATGRATYFGRAAELVRKAGSASHLEQVVLRLVRYFIALDLVLAAVVTAVSAGRGAAPREIVSFGVVLLLASVPVALPAAFTLAAALGSLELARSGILAPRMSAVQEAAGMDVVCIDKTGTITANRLDVDGLVAYEPFSEPELLRIASEASDEATQDPLDLAVVRTAAARDDVPAPRERVSFTPFDPATKRSEAVVRVGTEAVRVTKGAPHVITELAHVPREAVEHDVETLAAGGARVLGVAVAGAGNRDWRYAGLVALRDTPRPDAPALVTELRNLGVRIVMVTGDSLATARAIAEEVGIPGPVVSAQALADGRTRDETGAGVVAEVLPEHKFELVRSLQQAGHVVGMTGDGVNDAPALKQADAGIAVSSATDVAKSAAGIVLTNAGLGDIVELVRTSRRIHQRSLTYALNVSVKKLAVPLVLSFGVLAWNEFVFTPLLMALLLLANDVVSMSITTDRTAFAQTPDRWALKRLAAGAIVVALPLVGLSIGVLAFARDVYPRLELGPLQTLIFLLLVFLSQATVYLVRERDHFWSSRPGGWLLAGTLVVVLAVTALAVGGWLVSPLDIGTVAALAGVVAAGAGAIDMLKVHAFRRLGLHAV